MRIKKNKLNIKIKNTGIFKQIIKQKKNIPNLTVKTAEGIFFLIINRNIAGISRKRIVKQN